MSTKFHLSSVSELVSHWRREGESVVFTNGVFDILHVGHLHCLESAKSYGTRLVVAINSDDSVRRLGKGDDRPINCETDRAILVNALKCVDAVCVFYDDTPLQTIISLSPNVLAKGGDYNSLCTDTNSDEYIVGSKEIRLAGGTVVSIPLLQGHSTTLILKKAQEKK